MSIFRRQNELLGLYLPGFFKICISTNATKLSDFSSKDMSTYLHEYIHFLQNISTSKGLSNMIFSFHTLCDLFSGINQCNSFNDCFSKYKDIIQTKEGRMQEYNEFFKEGETPDIPNNSSLGNISAIIKDSNRLRYKVFFENNLDKALPLVYYLNSTIINEGMAYIIQKNVFPDEVEGTPRFPYNILREVSDYIISPPLTDHELIQICDLSLQTTRPGIDLIEILEGLRQGKTIEYLWEQEVISQNIVSSEEQDLYLAHLGCKKIVEGQVFQEALSCAFDGEVRSDIANYLKELCSKGSCYRKRKKQDLFSDLLKENKNTIGYALQALHRTLGSPNIFQIEDKFYFGAYAENQIGAPYLPILFDIACAVFADTPQIPCPYRNACNKPDHKNHALYNSAICDVDFLQDINYCSQYCMAKSLAFNMGIGNLV